MYKLTVKNSQYTIPKQNLKFLAIMKAEDLGLKPKLDEDFEVISFLQSINITVEEI